jgi:hypothetical protein
MQRTSIPYVSDLKTRLLLVCGAIAGPLFSLVWFITGLARTNYDPMRHPVSSLSIGPFGWTQVSSFLLTGVLTLALAYGLQDALQSRGGSKWTVFWIAAVGIGFLGAGLFVTDPVNGYPPGTPPLLMQPTILGRLHRLFSVLVFLGLPGAEFTMARLFARNREQSWAVYSRFSALGFLGMFFLASVGFAQVAPFVNYAGLLQRITLLVGLAWMTILPIYLLTHPSAPQATGRN